MKKGIIITLIIAAAFVALVFAYKDWNKPEPTNTTMQNTTSNTLDQTQTNSTTDTTQDSTSNTIEYDGSNFTPNQLTVDTGTTVTIKNNSSKNLQFDSDPHPAHTDNTELNVGVVAPGQSKTFTVTKKGTFGYHNHLNSSDTGTIVVL